MELCDINPHIRYAATHRINIQNKLDSICYDCRFFYFHDGSGYVSIDGRSYPFSPHTAFYFPAGTRYHFYMARGYSKIRFTVINFDLIQDWHHITQVLGTASEINFDPAKLIKYDLPDAFSGIVSKSLPSVADSLKRITEVFFTQDSLYLETSSALLKLCLMELIRSYGKSSDTEKITPILEYIHKNYHDPSLTNQSVADAFNYHPYYLSQLIKSSTGKTLHQYLTDHRLKVARVALVTSEDSVDTVSWKSGFLSTAYFIKLFKAQFGLTPGKYRKAYMQRML